LTSLSPTWGKILEKTKGGDHELMRNLIKGVLFGVWAGITAGDIWRQIVWVNFSSGLNYTHWSVTGLLVLLAGSVICYLNLKKPGVIGFVVGSYGGLVMGYVVSSILLQNRL